MDYVDGDFWVIKHKPTGATITLSGWGEDDAKTFDLFFKSDNKVLTSLPAQTKWEWRYYGK